MNIGEIANELSVVIAAYHLFWFTDYVSLPESELSFGWSIIGTILLNVLFNIVIFLIGLV